MIIAGDRNSVIRTLSFPLEREEKCGLLLSGIILSTAADPLTVDSCSHTKRLLFHGSVDEGRDFTATNSRYY